MSESCFFWCQHTWFGFWDPNWSYQTTNATLWVLDTCLIVRLLPFMIFLITASLSSKMYTWPSNWESFAFVTTWSTWDNSSTSCSITVPLASTWRRTGTLCSWKLLPSFGWSFGVLHWTYWALLSYSSRRWQILFGMVFWAYVPSLES